MSVPSDEHLLKFCRPGTETACAYFMTGDRGAECAKSMPYLAREIWNRLAFGEMNAKGDNCSGPPKFVSKIKLRPV